MDFRYLHVRCGPFRILVPGENVAGIDLANEARVARVPLHRARRDGWPLVIDVRAFLGLDAVRLRDTQVNINWHATSSPLRAVLVVDGVEGLRGGFDAEFLPLPRVPPAFQFMFDRLVHDSAGSFLLRLRPDIQPNLADRSNRRRFCRAVVGAMPPSTSRQPEQGDDR
jgi:hypothetical protein